MSDGWKFGEVVYYETTQKRSNTKMYEMNTSGHKIILCTNVYICSNSDTRIISLIILLSFLVNYITLSLFGPFDTNYECSTKGLCG